MVKKNAKRNKNFYTFVSVVNLLTITKKIRRTYVKYSNINSGFSAKAWKIQK